MIDLIVRPACSSCRIGSRIDSTIVATMPPITTMIDRFEQRQRGRGEAVELALEIVGGALQHLVEPPRRLAATPPDRSAAAGTRRRAASPPTGCRRRGSHRRSRRTRARRRRLWIVLAVSVSPSSSGRRLATIVASVRAIRAAWRSRISRPSSGRRSSQLSNAQPERRVLQRRARTRSRAPRRRSAAAHQ